MSNTAHIAPCRWLLIAVQKVLLLRQKSPNQMRSLNQMSQRLDEMPRLFMPLESAASRSLLHAMSRAALLLLWHAVAAIWGLTSSPAQYPWRERHQQMASSTRCPSDSSCSPCLPSAGYGGGFGACAQLPYHVSYCRSDRQRRRETLETDLHHRWQSLAQAHGRLYTASKVYSAMARVT